MKLQGTLKNIKIARYLAAGTLEQKRENHALKNMLKTIDERGVEAFENDEAMKNFSRQMIHSFQAEGLLNNNKTLSEIGKDIVKTGKTFQKMYGTFIATICEYNNQSYLLDIELYNTNKIDKNAFKTELKKEISFDKNTDFDSKICQTRNVDFDSNFLEKNENCNWQNSLEYDMELKVPILKISGKVDDKNDKNIEYEITENNSFKILSDDEAQNELQAMLEETKCFAKEKSETTSVIVDYNKNVTKDLDEDLINQFFETGTISLSFYKVGTFIKDKRERISNFSKLEFSDINLRTEYESEMNLLKKYLLQKSASSYLGYSETGTEIQNFYNLFEKAPAITEPTKNIFEALIEEAKNIREENPVPYLHLQAYADLSPEQVLLPYEEELFDFAQKQISIGEIVSTVFGNERNIKSISIISKFAPTNPTICRNLCVFSETVKEKFGIKIYVITQTFDSKNKNNPYEKQNREFFEMLKGKVNVIEKDKTELEDHDRYYFVQRENGNEEWYKMTCELDSLDFENDEKWNLRKDIRANESAFSKEITFIKIKENAVPEKSKKLLKESSSKVIKGDK